MYPIGKIVMKKFEKGNHRGKAKRYDNDRKYYWIDYNNGDSEKMSQKQLKQFKCIDNEPDIVKRFTRSSFRQANSIESKEKLNQSVEPKTNTLKNKIQFDKLKNITARPISNPL